MKLYKVMEPVLSDNIVEGEKWIHEIKWDGIRGITYIQDNDIRLFLRSGRERTIFYPELKILKELTGNNNMVLDGELVVFDSNQKPSFNMIMSRERVRKKEKISLYMNKYPVVYFVFDILSLNQKKLLNTELRVRKDILNNVLKINDNIIITDYFVDGKKLFNIIKERNYEGIVSKNIESKYIYGKKHKYWFKKKVSRTLLTVVGGVKYRNDFVKSILLGIYDKDGNLIYIGSASSGLKQNDFMLLKQNINNLKGNCPFKNIYSIEDTNTAVWFKPALTCWVSYLEKTKDGYLRHPKIIGFSKKVPKEAKGSELIDGCGKS